MLLAQLLSLRVLVSQPVRVYGDDVATELNLSDSYQTAFSGTGLTRRDDDSWSIYRCCVGEQFSVIEYAIVQYLPMLRGVNLVVGARHE